jgi:hypothetical protein
LPERLQQQRNLLSWAVQLCVKHPYSCDSLQPHEAPCTGPEPAPTLRPFDAVPIVCAVAMQALADGQAPRVRIGYAPEGAPLHLEHAMGGPAHASACKGTQDAIARFVRALRWIATATVRAKTALVYAGLVGKDRRASSGPHVRGVAVDLHEGNAWMPTWAARACQAIMEPTVYSKFATKAQDVCMATAIHPAGVACVWKDGVVAIAALGYAQETAQAQAHAITARAIAITVAQVMRARR